MEQMKPEGGEGGVLDLSALLGSLGQEGGPDLSSLLEMIGGSGPAEPASGSKDSGSGGGGIDFAALLGMLGGLGGLSGGEEKPAPPSRAQAEGAMPALDPAMFATFRQAMKALREPDRNITLLEALRPFLEPERQSKVDDAIRFLHLIKLAPLLQGLSTEGG